MEDRRVSWAFLVISVISTIHVNLVTSSNVGKAEKGVDMPLDSDVFRVPPGYNAPQQVRLTHGDHKGKTVIVSWITMDEPGSNIVFYWSKNNKNKDKARGKTIKYDTTYYHEVGLGHTTRSFSFVTLPKVGLDVPYTFRLTETYFYTGLMYNEFFSVPFELFGPSAYLCRDASCGDVATMGLNKGA